jgi:cob(I)alamin adenosyltransferase
MEQGLVQVYTGEGKGKTTAALGLALRACGHGLKVFIGQFAKGRTYGELEGARRLADCITLRQYGRGRFIRGTPSDEDRRLARRGWEEASDAVRRAAYDIVILDEIGIALFYGLLPAEEVIRLIEERPASLELVLTGRTMPPEIVARADLVTEMREIRHPYARGIPARRGIEY